MDKLEVILHLYAEWAEQIINAEVELDWCTDFGSYPEDFDSFRIEVGMLIREDDVSDLPSFYQHNFSCEWQFNEVEIYVLCFLHEVGHLQTWGDLTEDALALESYMESRPLTKEQYRLKPSEYAADAWVNDYLNNHRIEWQQWQARLKTAYAQVSDEELTNFIETLD